MLTETRKPRPGDQILDGLYATIKAVGESYVLADFGRWDQSYRISEIRWNGVAECWYLPAGN